jgi:hypothetical protein
MLGKCATHELYSQALLVLSIILREKVVENNLLKWLNLDRISLVLSFLPKD